MRNRGQTTFFGRRRANGGKKEILQEREAGVGARLQGPCPVARQAKAREGDPGRRRPLHLGGGRQSRRRRRAGGGEESRRARRGDGGQAARPVQLKNVVCPCFG